MEQFIIKANESWLQISDYFFEKFLKQVEHERLHEELEDGTKHWLKCNITDVSAFLGVPVEELQAEKKFEYITAQFCFKSSYDTSYLRVLYNAPCKENDFTPSLSIVNKYALCLQHDTYAFYHSDYHGGDGTWKIDGTIENVICTLKNDITPYSDDVLLKKCNQLKQILQEDLPKILQILQKNGYSSLMICVVPRAKQEQNYKPNQRSFRTTIQEVIKELALDFIDGTQNIIRHTNTRTTHRDRWGHGGDGPLPYCGITKDTCTISNVQGQSILLIDDLYTKTVGIDEDAIQALYDNGANKVFFYSIGKTVR